MIKFNSFQLVLVIAMSAIAYRLLIYSLYLFRKVFLEFKCLELYNHLVIHHILLLGKRITAGILMISTKFLDKYWSFNKITVSLRPSKSLIFGNIGAFFLVLTGVFDEAKIVQAENELTP